jgi:drug/metabolite transporter (DMT)-like permease
VPLKQKFASRVSLLFGAAVWGVIWYPYRALYDVGVSGVLATLVTYAIALFLGTLIFRSAISSSARHWKTLLWIALAAGWTNLAFVLAVIHGTVVRVTLLFYLAPLWTVIFSRILLREKLSVVGIFVIMLSLAGALTMLWRDNEIPIPQSSAEWLGLSAGLAFALSNVLTRRAQHLDVKDKSLAVWLGVFFVALMLSVADIGAYGAFMTLDMSTWVLIVFLGLMILVVSMVVQYGLSNTPSNQAIVIFLFELVVVAISSHFLASEEVTWREWVGSAMIISATLFSSRMYANDSNPK